MGRIKNARYYANDQLRTQYIRGKGVAALGFEGKYYGSHRDEQGSICWLSGEEGQVENAYEYDAFGVVKNQQGNLPNRLLYTGEQYDQETQQYYVRARYYNPVIGRFTQEDTYRGDGLNLYAYCHNNPVMYYDPSGHAYNSTNKEENAKKQNATGEDNTTRVGRWISQAEYDKMVKTGRVQMSGDNKVHVANPADIDAFGKQSPKGSIYVEFDVSSVSFALLEAELSYSLIIRH